MIVKAIRTRIFRPKEDLLLFIEKYLPKIKEDSVLVITSKIVALAENRVVEKKGKNAKRDIIRQESQFVLPTKHVFLTIKDGVIMANAGIDESNANGKIILLPKDSFEATKIIRNHFKKKHGLKNLGVIITDSRSAPLKAGITGITLGYAGFKGLKKYVGSSDIFGRPFKFSRVNVADSLAASAVLCMGEGNEQKPLATIDNAPIEYTNKVNKDELKIDIEEDMYKPMLEKIKYSK